MYLNIVVVYDVNTETAEGAKRLRHVAKICLDFGQRVQDSVFECTLLPKDMERFRARLLKVIDPELDSLRIYHLASNREEVVEVYGRDQYTDFRGPLMV